MLESPRQVPVIVTQLVAVCMLLSHAVTNYRVSVILDYWCCHSSGLPVMLAALFDQWTPPRYDTGQHPISLLLKTSCGSNDLLTSLHQLVVPAWSLWFFVINLITHVVTGGGMCSTDCFVV